MQRIDLKKRLRQRFLALPKALRTAPVYLAVSGGLDSSVLASVALELRPELPPLHFLHVNYGLRRPDCDREEALIRAWAERERVPLKVLRLPPRQKKPANLQAWARDQRFAFFRAEISRLSQGKGSLWLAHHLRDQAETVLLRFLRGAGLRGLGGMKVLEDMQGLLLFRPFLEVPCEALRLYADSHGVKFRHDRSNDTDLYLRNRIRRRILPLLKKENPRLEESLSSLAARSAAAAQVLEERAEQWLRRQGREALSLVALRRQAVALQSSILEAWMGRHSREPESLDRILPALLEALTQDRDREIPLKAGTLVLKSGLLRFKAKPPRAAS